MAGAFDAAAMKKAIERAFGAWESRARSGAAGVPRPDAHGTRVVLVDKPDLSQATLMFGHPGIRHADPDWYAVDAGELRARGVRLLVAPDDRGAIAARV